MRTLGSEFIGAVAQLAVKSSPLRVPYTCMAMLKANLSSPVSIDGRCTLLSAKRVNVLTGKTAHANLQNGERLMTQAHAVIDAFGD